MNKPSVSIIIPIYNVGPYIERCIMSVINQTYNGPMECVIVDDCGTDDSMTIIESIISRYNGPISFKMLHHTHNRGLSAARNTGMDAATGTFITFLDSDDMLPSDSLDVLAQPILKDSTIEMVVGNRTILSDGMMKVPEKQIMPEELDLSSKEAVRNYFLSNWMSVGAWSRLAKTDFLLLNHLYFKEGILSEDMLWTHYVMQHLSHLYIVPNVTYYWIKRPNSITTGSSEELWAKHKGFVFEEIAQNFTTGEKAKEAAHYLIELCFFICRYPNIPSFQRAATLFKQALSNGHHTKEKLLLSSIVFFSKTALGRGLMFTALSIRRCLRKIIVIRRLLSLM